VAQLVSGRTAVTTGGTAVPLSATSTPIRSLWIMAATANTNPVVVGGSDVVAAVGTRKGVALRSTDPPVRLTSADGVDELSDIYVDAVTNGEAVTWAYTTPN
jgi:hypothetical protein